MLRTLATLLLITGISSFYCFGSEPTLPQAGASRFDDPSRGAVVESLVHLGEGERAGLHEADILLSWSRGKETGEIHSPFDLLQVETEQAPLGNVTLQGLRGTETLVWSLGPTPWEITARPNFDPALLSSYLAGEKLARATKPGVPQVNEAWKLLVGRYSGPEERWIQTWLLFHFAEILQSAKRWTEADDAYQSALLSAAQQAPFVQGQILQAWGKACRNRNDWPKAESYLQEAIARYQQIGRSTLAIAASLDALGEIASQRGDLAKAEQYNRRALEINEELAPESLPVATSLQYLGSVAYDRGDLSQAEAYYRRAFEIRSKVAPDSLAVAACYTSLGIVAWQRGDLSRWDEYEHKALAIRKKLAPESFLVAASLNNLGMIAAGRGNLIRAEQYYREALKLKQRLVPDSLSVAGSLINIGNVEGSRGDLDRAEQYYRQALQIEQKLAPGSLDVGAILGNLGKLEQYRGDLLKAEHYYQQTLEIQQRLSPGSLRVGVSLSNLGDIAQQRGDFSAATHYYGQSLAIKEKLAPQSLNTAETIYGLGEVARKSGDLPQAEKYFRRALTLRQNLAPGTTEHAESLAAVASILRDQQHLDSAADFYSQAISALENQTSRLGGSEGIRSGFGANHSRIYSAYIGVLLAQNEPERAFEVLERSRARVLLDMLSAAHVDIRRGADPVLLEQERSIKESMAAKIDRRLRLLANKNDANQVLRATQEIEDLEKEYQDIEERLRLSSPEYAALTQPQPLSLATIQQLLGPDTLLLEYSLDDGQSHVFSVTSDSLRVHDLPSRAAIENQARSLYTLLTERNRRVPHESFRQWRERVAKADAASAKAVSVLGRVLLGGLGPELRRKRILIVADGALLYIPFAALPEPNCCSGEAPVPLVVHHEIVSLPSASTLATLRRQHSIRRHSPDEAVVVADPVFDEHDERVRRRRNSISGAVRTESQPDNPETNWESKDRLTRSAADVQLLGADRFYLPRLGFSRREADIILTSTAPLKSREVLDFDASRSFVISGELSHYRIVHFATHALIDDKNPDLSGLVLSLVDARGNAQNGFLDLEDIYNLDLAADLVVLSACDTALGQQVDGEGMIGLTRGFMHAGAYGVLGTLWGIDDFATAKFMQNFYTAMEHDGRTPAQALRQAQILLLREKHWSAPYYWSAFTLQGDWK